MRKYLLIVFLVSLCCANSSFAKDDKAAEMNKKLIEKEERQYQKDLRKNPGDVKTYWDHANNLAGFNTEFRRAIDFYKKAAQVDSTNALLYKDYGKYLFDKLHAIDEAKEILTKSLALGCSDAEIMKYLESVNKLSELRAKELKLMDFGSSTARELNPAIDYKASTRFDSLKLIVTDTNSSYSYPKLLSRYLDDARGLTPAEMYMLILGYSRQPTYSPYNYNDISDVKGLVRFNIDTAISKGLEVVRANPLNPSLNKELMYCYRKKNDFVTAEKFQYRVQQFFNGMLYSGNGTCDKPYISLWAREEYSFLSYLGYKPTDDHQMSNCSGQMAELLEPVNPATNKKESIYFNVQLIYLQSIGK
jgi:tetratricopeptide (TPR) repeat protein